MRDRIFVDPQLAPTPIAGRVLNELCSHALETRPEECCGLILGTQDERFRVVRRCRNNMTLQHQSDPKRYPRDGREAYYMSEIDYLRAQQGRTLFNARMLELFDQVDLLAGPTEPITAPKLLDSSVFAGETRMGTVAALTQYTRPYNITGTPAISVPCGFSSGNMPIGLQLAGRPFDEPTVLRAAHAYEQATDWHRQRPPI